MPIHAEEDIVSFFSSRFFGNFFGLGFQFEIWMVMVFMVVSLRASILQS